MHCEALVSTFSLTLEDLHEIKEKVVFKLNLDVDDWRISCENALRRMSIDLTYN